MATQTSTQVSGPSPFMAPYYNAFMPGAFQLANKPYESYGGPLVANLSDIEYQALSGLQNQMGGNPMLGQAQGLYSRLMGGSPSGGMTKPGMGMIKPGMVNQVMMKPGMSAPGGLFAPSGVASGGLLNNAGMGRPAYQEPTGGMDTSPGNPFMQQMIGDVSNQARQAYEQATGSINNRFTNPNSFGNSRHAMMQDQANEAFARGLGGALGQLQYNAYGEGLDRQMRAAQAAQGLQGQQFSQLMQGLQAGSIPRGIQQRQYDAGYERFQNAQNYPFRNAEFLSRVLSGTPGSQTVTQQPGPNSTAQILGGSLATLPFLFNFPRG